MMDTVDSLRKNGAATIEVISAILLGAGFKEASVVERDPPSDPAILYEIEREFVLPDHENSLAPGFGVCKTPANLIYTCGFCENTGGFTYYYHNGICPEIREEFIKSISWPTVLLLHRFGLAPIFTPNPEMNSSGLHERNMPACDRADYLTLGYEKHVPYLTAVYEILEKCGYTLQPVKRGKPFVFVNAAGDQVGICHDLGEGLVVKSLNRATFAADICDEIPRINLLHEQRRAWVEHKERAVASVMDEERRRQQRLFSNTPRYRM